jgi:hypothetical protein
MDYTTLKEDLLFELADLGYQQSIQLKDGALFFEPKLLTLKPSDLFFIDGIYTIEQEYFILAINAPLYNIKGTILLTNKQYNELKSNNYLSQNITVLECSSNTEPIVIKRQYNMRKILANEFEEDRYILKEGFPDFPPCPYGNSFKMLGYDTKLNEYVRISSSIVKRRTLKTIKYN